MRFVLSSLPASAMVVAFVVMASTALRAEGPCSFDTTKTRSADTVTDAEVAALMKGARTYTLVVLSIGPHRNQDSATADRLHRAHLRYLYSLRKQGKIVVLGPVAPGEQLRGICIYASKDIDEVRRLVENDPGVRSGRLVYAIHPWFGLPGDGLKQ